MTLQVPEDFSMETAYQAIEAVRREIFAHGGPKVMVSIAITDPKYPPGSELPKDARLFLLCRTLGTSWEIPEGTPIGYNARTVAEMAWYKRLTDVVEHKDGPIFYSSLDHGIACQVGQLVVGVCSNEGYEVDALFAGWIAKSCLRQNAE